MCVLVGVKDIQSCSRERRKDAEHRRSGGDEEEHLHSALLPLRGGEPSSISATLQPVAILVSLTLSLTNTSISAVSLASIMCGSVEV